MNTLDMEIMLMEYFGIRRNIIVPNVSWGLFLHECDLLVLTPSDTLIEIEIKISLSDLKADKKKRHGHHNNKISKLYFAIPDYLEQYIDLIPAQAGILSARTKTKERPPGLSDKSWFTGIKKLREAKLNPSRIKTKPDTRQNLLRLGTMRILKLKKEVQGLIKLGVQEDAAHRRLVTDHNLSVGGKN